MKCKFSNEITMIYISRNGKMYTQNLTGILALEVVCDSENMVYVQWI